jgi:hypothetical protein
VKTVDIMDTEKRWLPQIDGFHRSVNDVSRGSSRKMGTVDV